MCEIADHVSAFFFFTFNIAFFSNWKAISKVVLQ